MTQPTNQANQLKVKCVRFDDEWPKLRPVVIKLLSQQPVSKQEWQDLFWVIHGLCAWADRGAQKIYEILHKEIIDFIRQVQTRVLIQQDDVALLRSYVNEWQRFLDQTSYLPLPFAQIDTHLNSNDNGPCHNAVTRSPQVTSKAKLHVYNNNSTVREVMLESWRQLLFSQIESRLRQSALEMVSKERSGEPVDSDLIIGIRQSYVLLCSDGEDKIVSLSYKTQFEKAYLHATEQFYRSQAAQLLHCNGVLSYMHYADERLRDEETRALKYLDTSEGSDSLQLLVDTCVRVLVVTFQDQILAECPQLIFNNDVHQLQIMFRLLDRAPNGAQGMLQHLEGHIRSQGLQDMLNNSETVTTDCEKYVEQLLNMFDRFSRLVCEAFMDDPRFLTARDKAFQEVVNDITVFKLELPISKTKQSSVAGAKTQAESRCPELLASYCDLLLRKSPLSKRLNHDELDGRLKRLLLVLKYVQNKDVFMRYHLAHLARRLLLDASADDEKEELMVSWLREAGMPADYVNRLYRMLMDMQVSKDLNKAFRALQHNLSFSDCVNLKVLNLGSWSRIGGPGRVPISLPRNMEDLIPELEDFYRSQHNGRRLQWQHHLSSGCVQFVNVQGRFELDLTTFQMCVLFQWNERPQEKISLEALRLATELPDNELRRTLWSLVAFPKIRHQVLLCDCESRNPHQFTDSTLFWPNQQFCVLKGGKAQRRGRINLIGRLQLSVEQTEIHSEAIVQLRVLRVQEAIVKVLKMRKRATHAQLQTELIQMLKALFVPARKMIKEQLEWLIEQRYIARDPNDINAFVYLA